MLVFCGRLEDAFRWRKLLKRRGKQKWKVIGRYGGKSMGWVTASLWTQWEIQSWLFLMPMWLGPWSCSGLSGKARVGLLAGADLHVGGEFKLQKGQAWELVLDS